MKAMAKQTAVEKQVWNGWWKGEMGAIQNALGRSSKRGSGSRKARTLSIHQTATSDLLARVEKRPLKAILESGGSLRALRENRARTAAADAACRVLLARAFENMTRNGAHLPTCLTCPVFGRLALQDVAGCRRAGRASCRGKRNGVR